MNLSRIFAENLQVSFYTNILEAIYLERNVAAYLFSLLCDVSIAVYCQLLNTYSKYHFKCHIASRYICTSHPSFFLQGTHQNTVLMCGNLQALSGNGQFNYDSHGNMKHVGNKNSRSSVQISHFYFYLTLSLFFCLIWHLLFFFSFFFIFSLKIICHCFSLWQTHMTVFWLHLQVQTMTACLLHAGWAQ